MHTIEGMLDASGLRFGIVTSRFNDLFTAKLEAAAVDCLIRHKGHEEKITVVRVPGAWEIPFAAKMMAASGNYDALICLGALVRGSTIHFDLIAAEVSKALGALQLEHGVPVAFGVITTDSLDQAFERSGSKAGNKGWEAASAAIEMARLTRALTPRVDA